MTVSWIKSLKAEGYSIALEPSSYYGAYDHKGERIEGGFLTEGDAWKRAREYRNWAVNVVLAACGATFTTCMTNLSNPRVLEGANHARPTQHREVRLSRWRVCRLPRWARLSHPQGWRSWPLVGCDGDAGRRCPTLSKRLAEGPTASHA